jgi:hypothetical protein
LDFVAGFANPTIAALRVSLDGLGRPQLTQLYPPPA